jgi:uncharacterized protein
MSNRFKLIDTIRGLALFGILLVNMKSFQSPEFIKTMFSLTSHKNGIDQGLYYFYQLFIQMKFYPIFSFLFGLGFYLFMIKSTVSNFVSRTLFLLLIGMIHLIFFWYGDILHVYAITSVFLLFFHKLSSKKIAIWSISLLFAYHLFLFVSILLPASMVSTESQSQIALEYIQMYKEAPYFEWIMYRFNIEVLPILQQLPIVMIPILGWFLLGLFAGKEKLYERDSANIVRVKNWWKISLFLSVITVCWNGLALLTNLDNRIAYFLTSLSGISLAVFYITTIYLFSSTTIIKKILSPFQYVGRMSLTNYLAQSIMVISLFRFFHMYNTLTLAEGMLISVGIFLVQLGMSYLWLSYFYYGPIEWIWRSITYHKISPFYINKKSHKFNIQK